ncbi:MAG: nitrile hydratase [Thermoplasmata archaeon]
MHDRGGWPEAGRIDTHDHDLEPWEQETNALLWVLAQHEILRDDELRRAIEDLEPGQYESLGYYHRWLLAIENLLVEKDILTREEIRREAGMDEAGD